MSSRLSSGSVIAPCPSSHARDTCAWERTRRACARPSTPRRTRERACVRRGRRSYDPRTPGRSSTRATRCGSSSAGWRRSFSRCARRDDPRPTAPSLRNGSSAATLLAAAAAADDVTVGLLALLAGAVADGRHAPGRLRMVAERRRALTTAVRMVDRVHRRAARLWADAHVALAAGLADRDVLMVGVADDTDGGAARREHLTHLPGRQAQGGVIALLGHQLHAHAGRARELRAAPRLELDVVDQGADRHRGQRHRVADDDVGARAGDHVHADAQAVRGDDVGLRAVDVVQQRDVGRPVGVVLDRGHARGHAVLGALEVDLAVQPLGAAAAMARRLAAERVAPAGLLEALDEGALRLGLRDLLEVREGDEPATGRGGLGLTDRHGLEVGLEALEDRDGLAGGNLHDGLLPGPGAAGGDAAALGLGGDLGGAHLDHVDVEQRLDGLLDLGLVRLVVHAERVLVGGRQHVALLGDDRADDHLRVVHQEAFLARATRLSSAAWLSTSVAAPTRSATPTSSTCMTFTRARLRNDLAAASSPSARATSTAPPRWSSSRPAAWAVDGASKLVASSTCSVSRSACTESAERSAARRALGLTLTT